jgi:membrane-associated protease RseP (regulator of RpoE activity)
VKKTISVLTLATVLAAGGAFAENGPNAVYRVVAGDPPPAADEPPRPGDEDNANPEARLDAARSKLEAAAREVAELSAQMGKPIFQKFMTQGGEPGRAIIGVQLDASGGKDGARVLEVSPGGPAGEAGIRRGDVIVAVNGTEVKGDDSERQVVKIIRDVKPDSKVNVRVLREGKTRDFTITARPGPGRMAFLDGGLPDFHYEAIPGLPSLLMTRGPLANMELATLTPQLGRYFGTDKGVLVVRAPGDGVLKLEDGDVILAIDSREPASGSHATRILGSYQPGEKVTLRIMRQRKTVDIDTTLPEGSPGPHKEVFLRGGVETGPASRKIVILRAGEMT